MVAFTVLYIIHTSASSKKAVETCSWSCCKLCWYWGGVRCV